MKQLIVQLYPAISIVIMLLMRMKLFAMQQRKLKKSPVNKHGVQLVD